MRQERRRIQGPSGGGLEQAVERVAGAERMHVVVHPVPQRREVTLRQTVGDLGSGGRTPNRVSNP